MGREELETVNIMSLLKDFAIRELRYGTVYWSMRKIIACWFADANE